LENNFPKYVAYSKVWWIGKTVFNDMAFKTGHAKQQKS